MATAASLVAPSAVSKKRMCPDTCPCQQFQSETAILSAVESDAKAHALMNWLAESGVGDDIDSSETPFRCKRRLSASLTILNAIRDACRPFLETTTANPNDAISNKVSTTIERPENTIQSTVATYENSFPPLSLTSVTSTPTLLVGRKKKKDQKNGVQQHRKQIENDNDATYEDSFMPATFTSVDVAPTMLVGRKKKINDEKNGTKSQHPKKRVSNDDAVHNVPKETKNAFGGCSNNSAFSSGRISSLRSQHTSELPSSRSLINNHENVATMPRDKFDRLFISDQSSPHAIKIDEQPIEKEKLKRLADIYCAILKAHLAPVILLDIHLLMRLISLSDTMENSSQHRSTNKIHALAELFQSEACCIFFVSHVLESLEGLIISMGYETIKLLSALPPLQQNCPKLVATLKDNMNRAKAESIFETGQKALGSDSKTAHLTLPFDYVRDSRHNFRSLDLSRLFKEREELRDSFLYQLRAFQEVRGKLMDNEQLDNIINSIKREAREMMTNVSPGNIDWFVNLFYDLLLQIGLLPVGETDSEVLRHVADKKRLQKLQMRFTSKSGQKSKSSWKLTLDQKDSSFNELNPEQSFQEHQEFFFIVLQAGDSYRFNTHLKRKLAQSISEMTVVNETKGLCEHIAKVQILAKFLGLLVFSPNWDLSSDRKLDVRDVNSLPPLDLKMHIKDAWNDYRLVIVIPWVVKFLSMMRWDESSKKLPYYVDTFALLRSINLCCNNEMNHHLRNNMMIINLQLDSFFHDVVGLVATQNLPTVKLPRVAMETTVVVKTLFNQSKSLQFDKMPLWYSKQFLFTIPYFEDLFHLLSDLICNNVRPGNSCTKKVRPRSISLGSLNSGQKYVSKLSLSGDSSPWSSSRPGTPTDKHGIKERLIDSFFHQHKVLQDLCEIIVDRVIKNASDTIKLLCVKPIFSKGEANNGEYFKTSSTMSIGDYKKMLNSLGDECKMAGDKLIRDSFSQTVKDALTLLAPPGTDAGVLDIASSLAASHAIKMGEQIVLSAISDKKNEFIEEFVKKESKIKAGVSQQRAQPKKSFIITETVGPIFQTLTDLNVALKVIGGEEICSEDLLHLKEKKQNVTSIMGKYFIGSELSLQTIRDFEAQILTMMRSFFVEPEKSKSLLLAAVEVIDVLSLLNKMGYLSETELEPMFSEMKNLQTLMHKGPLTFSEVGNLLFVMIDGSLISHLSLEGLFLHRVNRDDSMKEVAKILLQILESNGQTIMVRLRKLLKNER